MRKYVNVVGVGEKRVSKKGWEYIPVSFTYEDARIRGMKAAHVNIGTDVLQDYAPTVGDTMDVVLHESNFNLVIDAVL